MSKVILGLVLLIFLFYLAPPVSAQVPSCKNKGYTFETDPSPLIAGDTPNTINLFSDEIKANDSFILSFIKEGSLGAYAKRQILAGGDGSISITDNKFPENLVDPSLPYGIRIQLIKLTGFREDTLCISEPFTVNPAFGAPDPDPLYVCRIQAETNSSAPKAKIVISGSGGAVSGSYIPFVIRPGSTEQPLSGGNISVNKDGTFGPMEYSPPINFTGGTITVGVRHSPTDARCTTTLTISATSGCSWEKVSECKKLSPPQSCYDGRCQAMVRSAGHACGNKLWTNIGCLSVDPKGLVLDLMQFVVWGAGGIAFLLMLSGAFQMITSAGNPETLKGGQELFGSAIIGLLFIIFATVLLKIIGVDILGLNRFLGY